ncbi:translation initiation factor IF-3 [Desulfohalovibrio reitneri]|uniref:translation initiation factor IF-3 n=1 Tax=Desulfohalovibrio reitneri TaxID=1307759 RepID=UPI0004A75B71|nr:translation initiation factor IF-3 [Desulfohalovibrio reitneri]
MASKHARTNRQIRVPQVRVIAEDGEQVGVIPTDQAMAMAQEKGLDLVEVAPNADPPVCRIMDYGKYKYEQQKKQQSARKKQSQVQIKEIKFRPKTDEHDYQTKMKHIRRFLDGGDRVKVTIFFRGREIVHKDRGNMILERVAEDLADEAKVEQSARSEGRTMFILLAPDKKQPEKKQQGANE